MALKNVFFKIAIASAPAEKVVFQLFDKTVPLTAANFRALCTGEKGYGFKGSPFHRIIPGFMAQGGDIVSGNGYGGKSIYGSKFKDENFILKHTHPFMLSMANSGPDTNSSQFFITFAPCSWLDGKHVVFGRVASGTEFIQTLEKKGTQSGAVKDKIIVTECGLVD